jgi:hypothetical protein
MNIILLNYFIMDPVELFYNGMMDQKLDCIHEKSGEGGNR